MKYWIYHTVNGIRSGIPICCVRYWNAGFDGASRSDEDPLAHKAEYVRCPKCCASGRIAKIKYNGTILHSLINLKAFS